MIRFVWIRLIAVMGCSLVPWALSPSAYATTVSPPGARITITSSGLVGFTTNSMPPTTIICAGVTSSGVIPIGSDNGVGSVTMTIEPPVFGSCITSSFTRAEVMSTTTSGKWTLSLMSGLGSSAVGTITVPSSGIVALLREGFSCGITGSWAANTPAVGLWTGGSASLAYRNQQMGISIAGATCPPKATFANLTGTFQLLGPKGELVMVT